MDRDSGRNCRWKWLEMCWVGGWVRGNLWGEVGKEAEKKKQKKRE